MTLRLLSAMSLLTLGLQPVFAECSDSGFCRLPGRTAKEKTAPAQAESQWSTTLGVGAAGGDADEGLSHQALEAGVGWQPRSGTRISAMLPLVRNAGDRGSAQGIGDLQVGLAQQLSSNSDSGNFDLLLGTRLPTGDDSALDQAPLGYQTGLGSTDLMAGIGWSRAGFDARLGYVAALGTNDTPGLELERGDDVAIGAGYTLYRNAVDVRGGLLVLHRLDDATITDGTGGRLTVSDSAGTQANAQITIGWLAAPQVRLEGVFAKALIAREENADIDGLTRNWALAAAGTVTW